MSHSLCRFVFILLLSLFLTPGDTRPSSSPNLTCGSKKIDKYCPTLSNIETPLALPSSKIHFNIILQSTHCYSDYLLPPQPNFKL